MEPGRQVPEVSAEAGSATLRFLTTEAGLLIGRGGNNIANMRLTTGASISVSKGVPGVLDRVVTISGTAQSVSDAVLMMAVQIEQSLSRVQTEGQSQTPAVTLQLLVPCSQAGAVMGKGGATVREITQISGAHIVMPHEVLPGSTERVCHITGTSRQATVAVAHLAGVLMTYKDEGNNTVYYQPGAPPMPTATLPLGSLPVPAGGPLAMQSQHAAAGATTTTSFLIPEDRAGSVIGKAGANIAEIRRQTGASIRVQAAKAASGGNREVTITGTPAAIHQAITLITSCITKNRHQAPGM